MSGLRAFDTTGKFCLKCGADKVSRTEVKKSTQRRSKRVRCEKGLQMLGKPFCDSCGTHREVDVALKRFKLDGIEER